MKKHFTLSLCITIIVLQATAQSANKTLSNLTSPTAVNVNLLPQNNNTQNLGSSGKSWKNLYVDGKSYLKTAYTYFNNATQQFRINNADDRLVIDSSGEIGIGTLSPLARFHINGDAGKDAFRVQINGLTKLYVNSGGGVAVGASTTPPANGLYVAGNVGIGTSVPSVK